MIRYATIIAVLVCFAVPAVQAQFRDDGPTTRQMPVLATTSSHVPSLVVAESDGTVRPLVLNRYELSVRILDFLVETTATYTFYNPKREQVEGVFEFPLPDGVTVDGYALDVDGDMIDGVALPRERATFVFETIERRGIDPGLVEQTGRNAFRSRIFPIPGHGDRTIRIRYTDRIASTTCTVPTAFDGTIGRYSVEIEAQNVPAVPKAVAGSFPGLDFTNDGSTRTKIFRAKTEGDDFKPTENLVLEFPRLDEPKTRIVSGQTLDENRRDDYFVLRYPMGEVRRRLEPIRREREKALRTPKRIAVYWDASGSRADMDRAAEIDLLRKYLAEKQCSVELYFLRDTPEPAGVYGTADYENLFDRIATAPCDGGTCFSVLDNVKHSPDLAILFSDACNTLDLDETTTGDELVGHSPVERPRHPIYIVLSGGAERNGVTHRLGERCFDLATTPAEEIVRGIGDLSLRAGGCKTPQNQFDFRVELDGDWLWIGGPPNRDVDDAQRETPKCEIDLFLGGQAKAETLTVPLRFDLADVRLSEIPKRFHAQRKLTDLRLAVTENRRAIREHGLKYGLVTPETSLIVLESLNQYAEFQVEPPDCKPDWRRIYRTKKTAWQRQVREAERKWARAGSAYLKRDWNSVMRWWEHSFDVPEGFQYVPRFDSRNEAFGLPRDRHDSFYAPYSPYRRYGRGHGNYFGGFGGGMGGGSGFNGGGMGGDSPSPRSGPAVSDAVAVRLDPASTVRKSPYLAPIRDALEQSSETGYAAYLEQRKRYARAPLFYWESAMLFQEFGREESAFRILRNIPELGLGDDLTVRRMLGYLMLQWNRFRAAERQFAKALAIDANDFASLRGRALARSLDERYRETNGRDAKRFFDELIDGQWNSFTKRGEWYFQYDSGFQLVASVERRRNAVPGGDDEGGNRPLDVDLRVVAMASHQGVDVALAVTEPNGERLNRDHALSVRGGALNGAYATGDYPALSQYMIRRAPKGKYKIVLERFDVLDEMIEETDDAMIDDLEDHVRLSETEIDVEAPEPVKEKGVRLAPGVVFVDMFTNYGRPDETRRSFCLTLDDETEVYEIGEIVW